MMNEKKLFCVVCNKELTGKKKEVMFFFRM